MLNLVPIADDEPAAEVRPVVEDKATIDRRKINRAAMKYIEVVRPYLYDYKGFPTGPSSLDPSYKPSPNGEIRYGRPRVNEMSGPSPWHNADGSGPGAWVSRTNGASGHDVISLVQYLAGGCDLKTATNWLRDLTDRLCEISK